MFGTSVPSFVAVLIVFSQMSFIYGILYLSLTAYSITFGQIYSFSPGVSGLPYIGTIIGIVAGFLAVVASNPRYVRALRANNNVTVPEWRLVLPMAGAVSFTGGLFFFGWTAYTGAVHWMAPTAAGVLLGFGIYTVFLQLLNYIIDSYLTFAASAIAANTFLRSLFGAVFPLFATQMYNGKQASRLTACPRMTSSVSRRTDLCFPTQASVSNGA